MITMVKEINEKEFNELKGTYLVDINATWCGTCKMLAPVLNKLSDEFNDVPFYGLDVDDAEEACIKYNVTNIPCVIIFKDGVEVARKVGFGPEAMFRDFVNANK